MLMLKLLRVKEILEFFPEFIPYQKELEELPASVIEFACYYDRDILGVDKVWKSDIPLAHKCTATMSPIDEAMEVHPDIVRQHIKLLVTDKEFVKEQEWMIEEFHLFSRELVKADNALNGIKSKQGEVIAKKLAADFLGADFVKKMEKDRLVRVDAKNGKSYWVTITGNLLRYKTVGRPKICTHIEGMNLDWDKIVCLVSLLKTDKRFCNRIQKHVMRRR